MISIKPPSPRQKKAPTEPLLKLLARQGRLDDLGQIDEVLRQEQAQARAREPLRTEKVDEFLRQQPPTPLIEGILHEGELSLLFGSPGAGKSLVALNLALAICGGKPWSGHQTAPGVALYLALEGATGMRKRVRAAREDLLWWPISHRLRFLSGEVDLFENPDHLADAIRQLDRPPILIVVDTVARASGAADENSAQDVGQILKNVQRIQDEFGTAILLIHHSRKTGDVERGSTCLRAACDSLMKVTKIGKNTLRVSCEKSKDCEPFEPLGFEMETVNLDQKELLNPCSSVRLVSRGVSRVLTPDWFTAAHELFMVLDMVYQFGKDDPPTSSMLAKELKLSRPTINRRLKALIEGKWLIRKAAGSTSRLHLGPKCPGFDEGGEDE